MSALFLLWWLLSATAFKNNPVVPSPGEVFVKIGGAFQNGKLWRAVWNTFFKSFLGFIISLGLGLVLAVAANLFKRVRYCADPVVTVMRAFPTLAVTYLLLMWFRTEVTAVVIGVFVIFPLFYTGLYTALKSADKKLLEAAHSYRVPLFSKLTNVYVPAAAPGLFSTMLSAFALNLKVVIAAEIVGGIAPDTVGNFLSEAGINSDYAAMFAWVLIAVMMAFLSEGGIRLIMRLCMPWEFPLRKKIARMFKRKTASMAVTESGLSAGNESAAPQKIEFYNAGFSYPAANVFRNFSARFEANKIHCILGPSGSGKTTLLNLAAGLVKPWEGSVVSGERVSYLFQEPRLVEEKTVLGNLLLVLYPALAKKGKTRKELKAEARARAEKFLKAVGLAEAGELYPRELSGGMAQRVALARAFSYPSDILLMDEPFKGLDYALKKSVRALLLDLLQAAPKTVLFVTHDIDEALLTADKVWVFTKFSPAESLCEFPVSVPRGERKLAGPELTALKETILDL